jgi:sarcosine oxidase
MEDPPDRGQRRTGREPDLREHGRDTDPESSAYVVVGAGLAGSATAWALAAAGHEVTLLERGVPADPGGSSHGSARIFRYAYADAFYVRLAVHARQVWAELEDACGTTLVTTTGSLDFGAVRDPGGLATVLSTVGVEHELVSPDEASRRWPGVAFDTTVLWQPGAGVIDAERSAHAMVDQACANGARLLTGCDVATIERDGVGYRLSMTSGASISAGRVVVAAGGWLPSLLPSLGLPASFRAALPRLTVMQEQVYHLPYRDLSVPWPSVIHGSAEIFAYSLPGGRDAAFRGQKLAEFCGGKSIGSAADQDGVIDPANRARMVEYATRYLPGLTPEPYGETTCLFTMTPTEDFVLDRTDGLTLLSPCSGHGAKFAPLVGRLAATVASAPDADAGRRLAPARFLLPR